MIAKIVALVVLLAVVQTRADDVAFIKLGTYHGNTYTKEYYIPRYFKTLWVHTRSICEAYGMDVVALEDRAEHDNFLDICHENLKYFEDYISTYIGGITLEDKNPDAWYWVNSDQHINYSLRFVAGAPNNLNGNEQCLAVAKNSNNNFYFNDVNCVGSDERKFFCQKRTNGGQRNFHKPCWGGNPANCIQN